MLRSFKFIFLALILAVASQAANVTQQFWNVNVASNLTAQTFELNGVTITNWPTGGTGGAATNSASTNWLGSASFSNALTLAFAPITVTNVSLAPYLLISGTNGLATTSFVTGQGYVTQSVTNGLYSASNPAGYVTSSITNGLTFSTTGLASQSWVYANTDTNGAAAAVSNAVTSLGYLTTYTTNVDARVGLVGSNLFLTTLDGAITNNQQNVTSLTISNAYKSGTNTVLLNSEFATVGEVDTKIATALSQLQGAAYYGTIIPSGVNTNFQLLNTTLSPTLTTNTLAELPNGSTYIARKVLTNNVMPVILAGSYTHYVYGYYWPTGNKTATIQGDICVVRSNSVIVLAYGSSSTLIPGVTNLYTGATELTTNYTLQAGEYFGIERVITVSGTGGSANWTSFLGDGYPTRTVTPAGSVPQGTYLNSGSVTFNGAGVTNGMALSAVTNTQINVTFNGGNLVLSNDTATGLLLYQSPNGTWQPASVPDFRATAPTAAQDPSNQTFYAALTNSTSMFQIANAPATYGLTNSWPYFVWLPAVASTQQFGPIIPLNPAYTNSFTATVYFNSAFLTVGNLSAYGVGAVTGTNASALQASIYLPNSSPAAMIPFIATNALNATLAGPNLSGNHSFPVNGSGWVAMQISITNNILTVRAAPVAAPGGIPGFTTIGSATITLTATNWYGVGVLSKCYGSAAYTNNIPFIGMQIQKGVR